MLVKDFPKSDFILSFS